MENLLGQDFMNVKRIYDLKGSQKVRKVNLSFEEMQGNIDTGFKVLKDLNYIEFGEKLPIE